MTKISAQVVADSKNQFGNRITTMEVTFPRFILAELNTHRVFSRNSASSRAIPFNKMVEMVKTNPFIPIAWQADHKGMQGNEYISNETGRGGDVSRIEVGWNNAVEDAISRATWMNDYGLTKQLCNRVLEPFMWHTVLITSTEWENFFALRCPQYQFDDEVFRSKKDALVKIEEVLGESDFHDTDDYLQWATLNKGQAEIHMMALAEAMWDAMNESIPVELQPGQWHIPFGNTLDFEELGSATADYYKENPEEIVDISKWLLKIATARAARISYTAVGDEDKAPDYAKDIQLHDRLLEAGHMSPFEHCGRAMTTVEFESHISGIAEDPNLNNGREDFMYPARGWSRNFRGFVQYRSLID